MQTRAAKRKAVLAPVDEKTTSTNDRLNAAISMVFNHPCGKENGDYSLSAKSVAAFFVHASIESGELMFPGENLQLLCSLFPTGKRAALRQQPGAYLAFMKWLVDNDFQYTFDLANKINNTQVPYTK